LIVVDERRPWRRGGSGGGVGVVRAGEEVVEKREVGLAVEEEEEELEIRE
jgi:hypothetical protein